MGRLPPDQAEAIAVKADWGKPVASVWVTIPSQGNMGRSPRKEGNRYTFEGEKKQLKTPFIYSGGSGPGTASACSHLAAGWEYLTTVEPDL